MALDHVAELARQAADDDGVLQALRNDPVRIRKPLNLSEAQLRALISAGSFSTARPVVSTSQPVHSLASQIAAIDVGTLFPPEGQGQFPTPGELPPIVVAPRSVPVATPVAGVAPRPTPPSPASGQAPYTSAPVASAPQPRGTPVAPSAPQSTQTPQATAVPGTSRTPATPVASTGTPQAGTGTPSAGGQASSSGTGGESGQTSQGSGLAESSAQQQGSAFGQSAGQTVQVLPAPLVGVPTAVCCGACSTAMISIVAELSTTAQAAITAITAIAGFG
jgi:hypothetical protein